MANIPPIQNYFQPIDYSLAGGRLTPQGIGYAPPRVPQIGMKGSSLAGGNSTYGNWSSGIDMAGNPGGAGFTGGNGEADAMGNVPDVDGFDWGGAFKNFNLGAQGVLGLAGAWNAYQQNKNQKRQLGLQESTLRTNVANQATTLNPQLAAQYAMQQQAMGLVGGNDLKSAYDKAPQLSGTLV